MTDLSVLFSIQTFTLFILSCTYISNDNREFERNCTKHVDLSTNTYKCTIYLQHPMHEIQTNLLNKTCNINDILHCQK